jgi:predicted PhzF superfamily epimerase YddE/YHI9
MTLSLYQVDAFARRPFEGNPAAVCLLEREADAAWMQAVAAEMNLSETAFVVPREGAFGLRWFTPTVEVDLCGHATLASAHVLWSSERLSSGEPARFETLSGPLVCRRLGDGRVEMDFPAEPPSACEEPAGLAATLGAPARWFGRNRMDWVAELADEATVRSLTPALEAVRHLGLRGLIVTARADAGAPYDFVSRFFAPQSGVPEDPVTGSAHCALAPLWVERLGRAPLEGFQASRRGGQVEVEPRDGRVLLRGHAVTVVEGGLRA